MLQDMDNVKIQQIRSLVDPHCIQIQKISTMQQIHSAVDPHTISRYKKYPKYRKSLTLDFSVISGMQCYKVRDIAWWITKLIFKHTDTGLEYVCLLKTFLLLFKICQ